MRHVLIYRGLPSSGKSTAAKKLLQKEPGRWVRVNRDSLREMFNYSNFSHDSEEWIRSVQDQLIIKALRDGYDVICDNTFLVPQTLHKLHRLLATIGDIKVVEVPFNERIAECIRRNELREGKAKVPQEVIHKMAKAAGLDRGRILESREFYYPPREHVANKYIPNETLQPCIISDLDGTLAIIGDRSPYDASNCDTKDSANGAVVEVIKLYNNAGYKIIFVSGRQEKDREPTKCFIEQHLPNISYDLFMRSTNDSRKDSIVKEELFNQHIRDNYNVRAVFDDRLQVCQLWHQLGLPLFRVGDPDASF